MAVSIFTGKTKSGKSWRVMQILKKKKKVLVFDFTSCFDHGTPIHDLSTNSLQSLLRKYATSREFFLVFKFHHVLGQKIDRDPLDRVITFASSLGMLHKRLLGCSENNPDDIIYLAIDEADKILTYEENSLPKQLVTYGRHSLLDTYVIAQDPNTIPTYVKRNASEIFTFKIEMNDYYIKKLGRKWSEKLETLPQYHYLYWNDSKTQGEIQQFNEKGKEVRCS